MNFDFSIINETDVSGISLIVARNEDAYQYLWDETDYTILKDGSAPVPNEVLGDFISDASWAHLCCEMV